MGETYIGCFVDRGDRDLPNLLGEGYGNYKACFEAAQRKGFIFAGLQFRGECWAGNDHGKYGQKPDSECNMECKKDKGRMCGAGWRNSIFSIPVVEQPPYEHKPIMGEAYIGCFVDQGKRDLPHIL